ncbi:MAG: hypothetical protein WCO84_01925 [bacterium]
MNNVQTIEKGAIRLGDTTAMQSFRQGVDDMLLRKSYFISQVLPTLKENHDYYVIKGKKSLAKGGAEKLASIYSLTATFSRDNETMEAFKSVPGLIAYVCNLYRGNSVMGQGRGASTLAKNDNDPNKTIKMSLKSAFIDGVIRSTNLSEIFTQDLEDLPILPTVTEEKPSKESKMITARQKELLTSLVKRRVHGDDEKKNWLAELEEMTREQASEQISSFIGLR